MISIIIPVYNVDQYLEKCLDSCFVQTYQDIEVIAVNDGSTDGCAKMLDQYAEKESRLRVIHTDNSGVARARSIGIDASCGDWLVFVDSDDSLTQTCLETLYQEAIASDVKIVCATFKVVYPTCSRVIEVEPRMLENRIASAESLLTETVSCSLCFKIFYKDLFRDIEHSFDLEIGEDGFLTAQLFNACDRVKVINTSVYNYFQREDSVLHKPSQSAIDSRLDFVMKLIDYYKSQPYVDEIGNSISIFLLYGIFGYLYTGGAVKYITSYIVREVKQLLRNKPTGVKMVRFTVLKLIFNFHINERFIFLLYNKSKECVYFILSALK